MNNNIFWLVSICICFLSGCKPNKTKNREPIDVSINSSDSITFVKRSGSPFEKGKQYGQTLKKDIQGQLDIWERLCKEEINLSQDELYLLLSEKTGFISAIKQYAPDLLEEIKGMAAGAEVRTNDLICLNLAEETIVYFTQGYQSCTNIGLRTESANLIAYNLDLPDFLRQFKPVVLQDEGQFIYTFPGIIAAGGMNKNFAVTTNSLSELNMDLNGLPLPFTIRKLLQFSSEAEAIDFLKSTPFGAPQNLMIVGRQNVVDYECSANQITKYDNPDNEKLVYHTNHALVNLDTKTKEESPVCERFSYLDSVFEKTPSIHVENALKEAIGNRASNIRYEGNYFSFLGKYPTDTASAPYLEVLLPKSGSKTILLKFD